MDGYKNEYNFVIAINNKRIFELNPAFQDLIHSIYNNIDDNQIIKAWRNHYDQKADILIKIGNAIKGISIKMGSRNSVHVEHIKDFISFLKENNIPKNTIDDFKRFIYADGTNNNTGIKRLSAEEYKIDYQVEIDAINKYFMDREIIAKAIDRFILKGNNGEYSISAIILGTPEDFIYIKQEDIIEILLLHAESYCTSPHFSDLVCQPMNRCINRNPKYEKFRNYIQIKWYRLFDDIIEQMNNNIIKQYKANNDK